MTDQVYFVGYRAEHFTGWDGTGSPSYSGIVSSYPDEPNKLGFIKLWESGNVIWKDLDITDTSNPVYIMTEIYFDSLEEHAASGNIFLTDGNNFVVISLYSTNKPSYVVLIGKYSSGGGISITNTLIRNVYPTAFSDTFRLYIKLSSTTSGFDTISVVTIQQGSEYTIYSGSIITPLSRLKSIFSCHFYESTENIYRVAIDFFYCVVANFDLTGSYIDYTTAASIGSTNQWSGDISTFSTYPVDYSSTGGMLSSTNNTSVSYKLSKTLNTTQVGCVPLAMILSSNDISSNSLYTNGYSGTYDISIPNYLASGTGISVVFYAPIDSRCDIFDTVRTESDKPGLWLTCNMNHDWDTAAGHMSYIQFTGSPNNTTNYIDNNNTVNGWNIVTLFNNNNKLEVNCNGTIVSGNRLVSNISSFTYYLNNEYLLASIAYTKSNTVSYPFDKDNNVTSYIDFVDPNNPVVYGDTTQLAVTSKSLTSTTAVSDVPKILITSTTKSPPATISPFVTDGTNSITTSDTATVTSSGNNSTFYLLEDPLTNSSWTSKNIQKYQFGLTKID